MAKEARKHNCVCTHTTCLIILDDLLNKELGGLVNVKVLFRRYLKPADEALRAQQPSEERVRLREGERCDDGIRAARTAIMDLGKRTFSSQYWSIWPLFFTRPSLAKSHCRAWKKSHVSSAQRHREGASELL